MRTAGVLSKKQRYFSPKLNLCDVWITEKISVSFILQPFLISWHKIYDVRKNSEVLELVLYE